MAVIDLTKQRGFVNSIILENEIKSLLKNRFGALNHLKKDFGGMLKKQKVAGFGLEQKIETEVVLDLKTNLVNI